MNGTGMWWRISLAVSAVLFSGFALAQQQMEGVRGADAVQKIFGVDAETMAQAIATARESDSILSTVAGVVNFAALLAAVGVILLTFINAILQTGEHGKAGGRYSMVWVPLRSAIAMGFLVPLSLTGYSLVQAMVLWLGMQGSGLGDDAWVRSNGYLSERMSLSGAMPPRFSANVASKLYKMEACAAAIERSALGDGGAATASPFGVERPDAFVETVVDSNNSWVPFAAPNVRTIAYTLRYSGTGDLGQVDSVCGAVRLTREVPLGVDPMVLTEQDVARVSMQNQARSLIDLQGDVRRLVDARMNGEVSAEQVRAELVRLEGVYLDRMRRATQIANSVKFAAEATLRQAQMETAEANGWLVAGAYYMTFAAFDAKMNQQINAEPIFDTARTSELAPSVLQDVAPQLAAADQILPRTQDAAATYVHPNREGDGMQLLEGAGALAAQGGGGIASAAVQQALDVVNRQMATVARDGYVWITESALEDGTGLVPRIVQWGHMLLLIAFAAFSAVVGASVVLSAATGMGGLVVMGIGMSFVVPLFLIGATMAYIIPAIPLLIWIAGVAGWLMMLVQAVVAAPLWAAAHASPEGEGFAGQRAMDGYMLLLGLLARPVLMIAGLLAGMLLLEFLGGFVLKAFHLFSGASAAPGAAAPGLVGMIVWIFLTAAILVVLTRWSFSLVHYVPDSVLRFIGARTEAFGETNMAEQARTMAVAAWMATQRAVGGATGRLGSGRAKTAAAVGGVSASKGT